MVPQIIPIRDLKNTSEISERCRRSNEPIFITKNGYSDMVIVSMETYEKTLFLNDVYGELEAAENHFMDGQAIDLKKT